MSPFAYTFTQRFTNSCSKSVDSTALIDPLAKRWERLVTTKLLDAPRRATAEATCVSLVALMCPLPQVVNGALSTLSDVPRLKFPPVTTGLVSVEAKLLARLLDMLEDISSTESHHWRILRIISKLTHFHCGSRGLKLSWGISFAATESGPFWVLFHAKIQ
ncbi:hypothetical protein C8J57DRAFT_1231580 [Mycena rebaudengoi]|nr:hypothetical protein C8J57DRAFT_1231580 [Mycena rebaudengoi]